MNNPTRKRAHLPVEETILIILILLSLAGIAITDFSPPDAFMYWMAMIFVFGIAAMIAGWHHARVKHYLYAEGNMAKTLFKVQSLHWLGSLAAVFCVFAFAEEGRMSLETASLMILLILALATFLDGVRIGWRFSLAGMYLALTSLIANYVEDFMIWLFALAIAIIVLTLLWEKRRAAP